LVPLGINYEVVVTDDCSTDQSWTILSHRRRRMPVSGSRFAYNCGESAASWAGMQTARGRFLVTMDADLQNDPRDLPKFLEALRAV